MSSSPSPSMLGEQVRRLDRDRFATAMLAAEDRREALFGLFAFNLEVAQIRELVREPMLGRIRLQWWRDTIAALYEGGTVAHPVAEALGRAIKAHALSRWPFTRLLDAREADLDSEPPADLASLESYAEGTGATINTLALEILGVDDEAAFRAARHLGIAWALTGLLRAVPFHASAGRLYLPADLLAGQSVAPAEVLAGQSSAGLAKVAEALAERARQHLARARGYRPEVPRTALPALLTAPLAERYLDLLARAQHDPFAPGWSEPRPQAMRLLWSLMLRRY